MARNRFQYVTAYQPRSKKDIGYGIDPGSKIPWGKETVARVKRNCHLCKKPIDARSSIFWWGTGGWCCPPCDQNGREAGGIPSMP